MGIQPMSRQLKRLNAKLTELSVKPKLKLEVMNRGRVQRRDWAEPWRLCVEVEVDLDQLLHLKCTLLRLRFPVTHLRERQALCQLPPVPRDVQRQDILLELLVKQICTDLHLESPGAELREKKQQAASQMQGLPSQVRLNMKRKVELRLPVEIYLESEPKLTAKKV